MRTTSINYPYGMLMPERTFSSPDYRYGFNGKENDTETQTQDYGMRIYNERLGRFLSVDPLSPKYPELTPFQFASNTPIWAIDLDGLEATPANAGANTLVIVIQGYMGENPPDYKTKARNNPADKIDVDGVASITAHNNNTQIQIAVYSSSQSENTKNDIYTTIKNFKAVHPNSTIIIVGHSLGADNAVELVNDHPDLKIDLLITLDILDAWNDDNIPENVKKAVNFYQTNDSYGGELIEIDNPDKTQGDNILAPNSHHHTIDNDLKGDVEKLINKEYLQHQYIDSPIKKHGDNSNNETQTG